jgi:hypothetical protein
MDELVKVELDRDVTLERLRRLAKKDNKRKVFGVQWLVVHGDQRGFVWDDRRADHGGIAPVRDVSGQQMTLADWYTSWLNEAECGGNKLAVHTTFYTVQLPTRCDSRGRVAGNC